MIPTSALVRLVDNVFGKRLRSADPPGAEYWIHESSFYTYELDPQDKATLYRIASGEAYEHDSVRWSRDDVQRVLYSVVRAHEQAQFLGGDSELLRDLIRIARATLKDNGWWPPTDEVG